MEALFTLAGFNDADEWANVLQEKIRQIAQRPPCV